ncbi:adiponectin receptor protein 1 [Trypanosoma conorhini]|uniref:Adiponectin receptor protein 1 n=1 Tax=Trypanosoma conorhini TaxID=83891 RepID=A0A422QAA0_9TRYP|nr:adiponectin receptor protein 1 [Trypanosoma conorhini]RNF26881.1 adiponectin receptor protein 1 [Trypanosoma conorhini]
MGISAAFDRNRGAEVRNTETTNKKEGVGSSTGMRKSSVSLPLYSRDDLCVPQHLKGNPYIITGYRACYTTRMCLRSLFALHNETLNVWSHGVGFIVFWVLTILFFSVVFFTHEDVVQCVIYGTFCFACLLCMGCSTVYHLFLGHRDRMLLSLVEQMDYYGISVLIVASFYPPLYFGFYCEPFSRAIYMVCIGVLGGLCLGVSALPWLRDVKFHWLRLIIYVATVFTGVVPFVHNILLKPHNAETLQPVVGIALMFLLYGTGVLFYSLRIPERWYPGEFDLFLSSHQIWHALVFAAACVHFFACTSLYQQWALSRGAC